MILERNTMPKDWLPENDLVYFMLDTVKELDIQTIMDNYEWEKRGFLNSKTAIMHCQQREGK